MAGSVGGPRETGRHSAQEQVPGTTEEVGRLKLIPGDVKESRGTGGAGLQLSQPISRHQSHGTEGQDPGSSSDSSVIKTHDVDLDAMLSMLQVAMG